MHASWRHAQGSRRVRSASTATFATAGIKGLRLEVQVEALRSSRWMRSGCNGNRDGGVSLGC